MSRQLPGIGTILATSVFLLAGCQNNTLQPAALEAQDRQPNYSQTLLDRHFDTTQLFQLKPVENTLLGSGELELTERYFAASGMRCVRFRLHSNARAQLGIACRTHEGRWVMQPAYTPLER